LGLPCHLGLHRLHVRAGSSRAALDSLRQSVRELAPTR
jgi:hypothetical protein